MCGPIKHFLKRNLKPIRTGRHLDFFFPSVMLSPNIDLMFLMLHYKPLNSSLPQGNPIVLIMLITTLLKVVTPTDARPIN